MIRSKDPFDKETPADCPRGTAAPYEASSERALFLRAFGVPEAAYPVIDAIVTPLEQRVIAALSDKTFGLAEIGAALSRASRGEVDIFDEAEAAAFAGSAYGRGLISAVTGADGREGPYKISDFYGRLAVFAIVEQDAWRALPKTARAALDDWYFDAYYAGLDRDAAFGKPTDENILTLAETLDSIDANYAEGRQLYLTKCDCRSLRGDCGAPTSVCLSYRVGPNSYPDRGISKPVTREEARAVVAYADSAALVHTVNPNGICNCCSDCCYLFRARKRMGSGAVWPESRHIITLDASKCVACGLCAERCRFGVFDDADFAAGRTASADEAHCVGCGLCVGTCPSGALGLRGRTAP
jgi:ferredoxin